MIINQTKNKSFQDGIIVPPGCDNPSLYDCGEKVSTYTPDSYKPYNPQNIPVFHPMQGKSLAISVPKKDITISQNSMSDYLNKFTGATLCLDLWINSKIKIKKCGTLLEVGSDFLVLRENNHNKLTIIDLKPVKYINIYCK